MQQPQQQRPNTRRRTVQWLCCSSLALFCLLLASSSMLQGVSAYRDEQGDYFAHKARPLLLSDWTVKDVQDWLGDFEINDPQDRKFKEITWKKYMNTFKEHLVDGEALLTITEDELKEAMNINNAAHRKLILSSLTNLHEGERKRQQRAQEKPMTKAEQKAAKHESLNPKSQEEFQQEAKAEQKRKEREAIMQEKRNQRLLKKNLVEVDVEDDEEGGSQDDNDYDEDFAAADAAAGAAGGAEGGVNVHPEKNLGDLSMFTTYEQESIRNLEALLTFRPKDVETLIGLARIYLRSEHTTPKAKKMLDRAFKMAPNHAEAPYLYAEYHRLYGAYDKAIPFYAKSLSLNPVTLYDGAQFRLNYAKALYQYAMELFNIRKEFDAKTMLERAVTQIVEAFLIMPHTSYTPWITPFMYAQKLERYNQKKHVFTLDPQYGFHEAVHNAKILLAECYLKLSTLFERQAVFYGKKLDDAKYAHWKIPLIGSVPVEPETFVEKDKVDFYAFQNHTVHLYAMSLSYLERIHESVAVGYVEKLKKGDAEKLAPIYEESLEGLKRINHTWVHPLERKNTNVLKEQESNGLPAEGFHVYQNFKTQHEVARKKVLTMQYQQPTQPIQPVNYFNQKLLGSVLHSTCKVWGAHELLSHNFMPKRDPLTNQTKFHTKSSEFYLQSSRFPFQFAHRKEIRHVRDMWEKRLDTLLGELNISTNNNAATTYEVDSPLLVQGDRWANLAQVERTRFNYYSTFHGMNNKRIAGKLADFYEKMTTPLVSPTSAPNSFLTYTARHLRGAQNVAGGLEKRLMIRATDDSSATPSDDPSTLLSSSLTGVNARRIKIGFVSAFFDSTHQLMQWLLGYIQQLDRTKYQVIIYWVKFSPAYESTVSNDPIFMQLKHLINLNREPFEKDQWLEIPRENLDLARSTIEGSRPDVLILNDVGLETTSFFLGFSKLAPVQATTLFLHHDTSGLKEIETALAFAGQDVPASANTNQSASNYFTEKLELLPGIGYHFMPNFTQHLARVLVQTPVATEATVGQNNVQKSYEYIPLFSREHFQFSNNQLRDTFQISFNDTEAPEGASTYVDKFDATTQKKIAAPQRTVYFVAEEIVAYFTPGFLQALGSILAKDPSSILVLMIDPGVHLSTNANNPNEEILESVYGGMKNACKDIVLSRVERWLKQKQSEAKFGTGANATIFHAVDENVINPALVADNTLDVLGDITLSSMSVFTPDQYQNYIQSGRVRFIPKPQDRVEYLNLLENVDVMLQPFPVESGASALDAIQVALPVVYPTFSPVIGGRVSTALFSAMNVTLGAASDIESYVDTAVKLGRSSELRKHYESELVQNRGKIYEDRTAVRHFEMWIQRAVNDKIQKAVAAQSSQ